MTLGHSVLVQSRKGIGIVRLLVYYSKAIGAIFLTFEAILASNIHQFREIWELRNKGFWVYIIADSDS